MPSITAESGEEDVTDELDHLTFDEVKAGQWVSPQMRGYLMKCCDCGLVHKFNFRVVKVKKTHRNGTWTGHIQGASYRVQLQPFRVDA
jgi:hypothetical protein